MGFDILRGGNGDERTHLGHVDGHAVAGRLLDRAFGNAKLCVWDGEPVDRGHRPHSSVGTEKQEGDCEDKIGAIFHDEGISLLRAEGIGGESTRRMSYIIAASMRNQGNLYGAAHLAATDSLPPANRFHVSKGGRKSCNSACGLSWTSISIQMSSSSKKKLNASGGSRRESSKS